MISEPALDRLSAMFRAPDVSSTRYEIISILDDRLFPSL